MTVVEIRTKLKLFNLARVAKATDIKYSVLRGIVANNRKAGYEDVQKIIEFLKQISA